MRYTKPGIRVITVFFAALVGFGLKHLADVTKCSAPDIYPHQFSYFVLAVLLFLRFLLGSANHLWCEHIRTSAGDDTWNLGFDLAALTGYGLIAVRICYAENLGQFLYWSVGLLFAAGAWSVVDRVLFPGQKRWWIGWLIINIAQGSVILCVALWLTDMRVSCFDYHWWKVILFPLYFLCLVADFWFQMWVLKPEAEANDTTNTDGPGTTS